MCIRDRSGKEPDGSVAVDEAVAHGAALHAGNLIAKSQGKTCLLYTSDAADDLPSVDPGGRRIIKKKPHTNTY